MDSRTKMTNNKRFVRYSEGAEMYSMSVSKFMQLAKRHKKCWRICVDQETTWILWLPILKMVIMPKIF